MADVKPEGATQETPRTVTEEQIITERKFPRRSFLTATGALLAGAVAIASGVKVAGAQSAQSADPDKKTGDPDKKKKKSTMTHKKMSHKGTDPDKKKKKTTSKAKPKTPPKSDPDGARL